MTLANMFILYKKYRYVPFFSNLEKIQTFTKNNIVKTEVGYILGNINDLMRYAKKNVPYFIDRKDEYIELESIEDIKNLPIISKKTLKENSEKFLSKDVNFFNATDFKTSGTTGTPMRGKIRIKGLQKRYKAVLSSLVECGFDISKPYARFIGKQVFDAENIYRVDFLHSHLFFSCFHLSPDSIKKYHKIFNKYKIESVEGYPSVISQFAGLLKDAGLTIPTIKFVGTTAERLHENQKLLIEEVFKCRVFDYYGSNEQSPFIFSCEKGNYHLASATGFVEIVDDSGRIVTTAGKEGKMIVTSFTSHFMPLIRYEIGDRAVYLDENCCECGRKGIVFKEIIGRDKNTFVTLSGKRITRFSIALKTLPEEVLESQIILSNKNQSVKLNYVSLEKIEEKRFIPFKKILHQMIGEEYTINIFPCEYIERSNRGKFLSVVIDN